MTLKAKFYFMTAVSTVGLRPFLAYGCKASTQPCS